MDKVQLGESYLVFSLAFSVQLKNSFVKKISTVSQNTSRACFHMVLFHMSDGILRGLQH